MDAMAGLVKTGKISYIGVSNFSAVKMRRAHAALAKHGLPLASNQVRFNLLDRRLEKNGVLETAKELNISIIAYSPLAQGLLTGKFHSNTGVIQKTPWMRRMLLGRQVARTRKLVNKLDEIASLHNHTITEVVLSWTINFHGDIILAIPGATKPAQIYQNIGALTLKLTPQEMAAIDHESHQIG
jgi:aryl-alcohol dehydrogenase-like predicted oxidoreductase